MGWSAPSMRQSIWRQSATDMADVLSAISRARPRAVSISASGATTRLTSPPASASSAGKTRPLSTHSVARLMPTTRGRNQLLHASATMPRRAKTKPMRAPLAAMLLQRLRRGPARVVEGAAAAPQVRAGAEGAPGAGHDDGAHRIVGVGALEGVEQFVHHAGGEGVQPLGAVQGEGEH